MLKVFLQWMFPRGPGLQATAKRVLYFAACAIFVLWFISKPEPEPLAGALGSLAALLGSKDK
jgi:hypothetical protein